jgi:hypothetical protein
MLDRYDLIDRIIYTKINNMETETIYDQLEYYMEKDLSDWSYTKLSEEYERVISE